MPIISLNRQEKMFLRLGVELPRQTLCGWMGQCAELLDPLYERAKKLVLAMIAQLYGVEKIAREREIRGEARRILREQGARPVLGQLHDYLLRIRKELLPKSAAGQAVSYALNHWTALTRYCEDGDLEI